MRTSGRRGARRQRRRRRDTATTTRKFTTTVKSRTIATSSRWGWDSCGGEASKYATQAKLVIDPSEAGDQPKRSRSTLRIEAQAAPGGGSDVATGFSPKCLFDLPLFILNIENTLPSQLVSQSVSQSVLPPSPSLTRTLAAEAPQVTVHPVTARTAQSP